MTPTTPPRRPPKPRVLSLWDDVDQARRAWAITQACRLHSGTDVTYDVLKEDAEHVLGYVLEEQQ